MKYALLIVEIPFDESRIVADMRNWSAALRDQTAKTGIHGRLNAGAYLIDLANGLQELSALCAAAEERQYVTRTLFFDQEPPFVISKPCGS